MKLDKNTKRLIYLIGGYVLYQKFVAKKPLWPKKTPKKVAATKPPAPFVKVPAGPLQAHVVQLIDGLVHDFKQADTDEVKSARNAIASNDASLDQKKTAALKLDDLIAQVEGYGGLVPEAARNRVAELKTALHAYVQTELAAVHSP